MKEVFNKYDNDNDGYLNKEDFLNFYKNACREKKSVVWHNFSAYHIRNDLKKFSEVEEDQIDEKSLPRYVISFKSEYFNQIFELLDLGGEIAIEAWKLLRRLPTNPYLYQKIVHLESIRGTKFPDWESILNPKFNYKFYIIFIYTNIFLVSH